MIHENIKIDIDYEKLGIKRNRINLKEAIESDKEQIRQKDEITPDIVKKKTHHVHH